MIASVQPLTKTELSELALDAAVEIDLGAKHAQGDSAVAHFLRVISDQITDHGGSFFLKDESLLPIYSYALSNDLQQEYVDRQGMLTRLSQIADKELDEDESQEGLRKFFLALHEALSTDLIDEHVKTVVANEQIR